MPSVTAHLVARSPGRGERLVAHGEDAAVAVTWSETLSHRVTVPDTV